MVIEPRVVQFWSEIILVISNRTCAARSFDFEITRIISAQIALHSVQLPLYIAFIMRRAFDIIGREIYGLGRVHQLDLVETSCERKGKLKEGGGRSRREG